ncbi:MAG: hypothetical protein JXA14_27975 [Anaerolineae bacterium]|nr:hypothetical protein [Anaerolineae bacterium]
MLPLVELPEIVQHYAPWFESVFSPEALLQFQRYLSGLIISDNKTVLLRATPHDEALLHKLQRELEMKLEGGTPFWRRVSQAQSLWALACFISAGLTQGQTLRALMAPLLAAACS